MRKGAGGGRKGVLLNGFVWFVTLKASRLCFLTLSRCCCTFVHVLSCCCRCCRREPIVVSNIPRLVPGWTKPIVVGR